MCEGEAERCRPICVRFESDAWQQIRSVFVQIPSIVDSNGAELASERYAQGIDPPTPILGHLGRGNVVSLLAGLERSLESRVGIFAGETLGADGEAV